MHFLWPQYLWLMAALPLLILLYVWLLRRKKKMAVRYASLSIVKEAMGPGQVPAHPARQVVDVVGAVHPAPLHAKDVDRRHAGATGP